MLSLRDKLIYWDHDYQYCEFSESLMLNIKHLVMLLFQIIFIMVKVCSIIWKKTDFIKSTSKQHSILNIRSHVKQFCPRGSAVHGSTAVNIVSRRRSELSKDTEIQYLYRQSKNPDLLVWWNCRCSDFLASCKSEH